MAWIELHQAVRDHRKTQALAECLGMPEPHVVGHLVYLWLWALDNAPDGRLPRSPRILARAAWWEGDGDTWVASLRTSGWIDVDEDGDVRLHDWAEYAGRLIDQRRGNAERQARFRERRREAEPIPNGDVTVTSPLPNGLPYRTRPNQELTTPLVFPPSVPTEAVETTTAEKVKPKLVPSRIPDEFPVTAAMTTFAERLGLPPPLVETETEKFLDHFKAKGERKSDWVAAWRNWMRRIGEFQPPPVRSRPMNGTRPTPASSSGVVSRSDGAAQRRIMGRD